MERGGEGRRQTRTDEDGRERVALEGYVSLLPRSLPYALDSMRLFGRDDNVGCVLQRCT